MKYQERITITPGKRSGKPCIRDTRITVYDILEYLASGMPEEQIIDEFPELEKDDIRAALLFAADRERKLTTLDVCSESSMAFGQFGFPQVSRIATRPSE